MQEYFFIRLDKKNVKISFQDILFVEASKNYIRIVTRHKAFMCLLSMRQMEEILPETVFCRVHRSYIVSLNHISSFDNTCVYIQDKVIPVGEQFREVLPKKVVIIYSDVRRVPSIPISHYSKIGTAS